MTRIPPELTSTPRPSGPDPMTHLGQTANIAETDELGRGEWTTLYEYRDDGDSSRCLYSAFLSSGRVAKALQTANWDLSIGDGGPGFTRSYDDGVETTTYDRVGVRGAEPILYARDFHGIKPRQFDLSEEFRLFHNLYHDRQNDRFIYVDDRGGEVVAAEITPSRSRVLTRLLRQYMAARQLTLALFFDHRADADGDLDTAKAALPSKDETGADRRYSFHVGDIRGRAFSRLVGKKLIPPPPVAESGIWPYETGRRGTYAEFIIGVGEDGRPIMHGCDPEALANYFGANESAPHYLTPVWFTRDVLAKYYDDPKKFSVEDGHLRCGSLWGIQIDNNLPDHVVVYLGDLGRDLHHEEQTYWRHFNVAPAGLQSSETNFRRSFLAQFTDPTAPDLVFKQRYTHLAEAWAKRFGWPLFRPLHEGDAHIIKQLRVPMSDGAGEFENQVLFLVKLLIDSLNDVELATACGGALPDEKSISKFKRYLETGKYPHVDRDIGFLRTLQNLRSSGAAHAKGGRFDKLQKQVGLDRDTPRDVFRALFAQANYLLAGLLAHFVPSAE
jgi:hypothetical protein